MRRVISIVVLTAVLAVPALAGDDGYRFHLRVTDGRTGFLANPRLGARIQFPRWSKTRPGCRPDPYTGPRRYGARAMPS